MGSRSKEITIDSIKEEHEQMEELLEGLLIFPNLSGLHRGYKLAEVLFAHEQQILLSVKDAMDKTDVTSVTDRQKKILKIFRKEINNPSPAGLNCGSC